MKKNRVRELWQQGKPAVQGWCSTGNPYIAEIAKAPEIDGLYIGPSDLSLDMGMGLNEWPTDARHGAAVQRISAQVLQVFM